MEYRFIPWPMLRWPIRFTSYLSDFSFFSSIKGAGTDGKEAVLGASSTAFDAQDPGAAELHAYCAQKSKQAVQITSGA